MSRGRGGRWGGRRGGVYGWREKCGWRAKQEWIQECAGYAHSLKYFDFWVVPGGVT